MKTIETEVRALLKAIEADRARWPDTYSPSATCDNEVCRILARLEARVIGTKAKTLEKGHAVAKVKANGSG